MFEAQTNFFFSVTSPQIMSHVSGEHVMLIFIVMTLTIFVIVTPIYIVTNRQMAEQKI